MSDSPKYSHPSIAANVLQRLLQNRVEQAAAERRLRQAEAQRRQQERVTRLQGELRQQLATARSDLATLTGPPLGPFAAVAALESLRQRLRQAETAVDRLADEGQGRKLRDDLRGLGDDLKRQRAEAESARLSSQLAEDAAALEGLRQQLAAIDPARAAKFDAPGRQDVESALNRADGLLQRKGAEARAELGRARGRLEEHRGRVEERFARWSAERDRAASALAGAGDRLAGLQADPVVQRWAGPEIAALAERLTQAEELLTREDFSGCQREAAALTGAADAVVARAGETQFKEDQRQYIVGGIVESMRQLGLVVQAGYPQPEHPGVPASATIIQAVRLGGGAIAVSVPQEGDIWYDLDDDHFPKRVEASAGGYARTCNEAEQQIEQVHQALLDAFGIEMGELLWEGKDPSRIRKTAKALPGSAGAGRQQKR